MNNDEKSLWLMLAVAVITGVLGIGKLLSSGEHITWRLAIGRAIVHAGLGLTAFLVLAFIPDVPIPVIVGLASLIASLGQVWVENLLQDWLKRGK